MKILVLSTYYKSGRRYVYLSFGVNGFERFRDRSTFLRPKRVERAAAEVGVAPEILRHLIDSTDGYAEFEIVDGRAVRLSLNDTPY